MPGLQVPQPQVCGVDGEVVRLEVARVGALEALQLVDPVLFGGSV